jgi:hypothetical protein
MIGRVALLITPVNPISKFVLPPILLLQSKSPARILSVPELVGALGNEKVIELLSAIAVQLNVSNII